jgi:hypothetical protein
MATTFETSTRIRIEAPDAAAALGLERRLAHLHPAAVGRGSSWCVELEDDDDRLDEITATVEHWLRGVGSRSTQMHVDGAVRTVRAYPAEGSWLAAGYDRGPVLEHEP